ncbi:MAG: UDP-N-acetylmuramoyl-L-alanine--D-glutamate ligase [Patescibacteria group bacterium]
MDYKNYFRGKKITVMGLGLLGRGVGDAIFLAKCGAKLIVADLKTKEQLKESLLKLKKYNLPAQAGNIKYVLGKHRLEDFKNCDMVLKAAGVPLDSPYIKEARKNKIPVEMSASLFAKLSGVPIIGVTGTRGKSTVAYLIYHILKLAGKRVFLGGNILGVSTLAFLSKANLYNCAVLELDSWQLQGFGDSKISPHISVFTTFYPDHMNYYGEKMKHYFSDKAFIFLNQKKNDIFIAGKQVLPYIKKWGGKINGKLITPQYLTNEWKLSILGEHNRYNATLAVAVAKELGIKEATIKKALKSFKGVPYRLELIRTIHDIKFYNDTTATTPEATLVALKTLGKNKKVILIIGGADKGLDMSALVKKIPKYCKAVIFLSGSGTKKLEKIKNIREYDNLRSAVKKAYEIAKKGDIVLLSPAFASFGMFKNEYDRGEQFNRIVSRL